MHNSHYCHPCFQVPQCEDNQQLYQTGHLIPCLCSFQLGVLALHEKLTVASSLATAVHDHFLYKTSVAFSLPQETRKSSSSKPRYLLATALGMA